MKKIALIILTVIMTFSIVSCNSGNSQNTFIPLNDNEILVLGDNRQFMNYCDENVETTQISYLVSVDCVLKRSYSSRNDSVEYEGWHYYWEIKEQYDTLYVGQKTIKETYTYEYMPYIENRSIAVKTIVNTETSYDYEGGWIIKDVIVNKNLNGYFSSVADIQTKCPELAAKVNLTTYRHYYLETNIPKKITYFDHFSDDYYYIEEK